MPAGRGGRGSSLGAIRLKSCPCAKAAGAICPGKISQTHSKVPATPISRKIVADIPSQIGRRNLPGNEFPNTFIRHPIGGDDEPTRSSLKVLLPGLLCHNI